MHNLNVGMACALRGHSWISLDPPVYSLCIVKCRDNLLADVMRQGGQTDRPRDRQEGREKKTDTVIM